MCDDSAWYEHPKSFIMIGLYDLVCEVRYEFNGDHQRLYAPDLLLPEGDIQP